VEIQQLESKEPVTHEDEGKAEVAKEVKEETKSSGPEEK